MSRRVLSLCSGVGALDFAHRDEVVCLGEINPVASEVLAARFPGVPNVGDWTLMDTYDDYAPTDITAGLPCQPVSAMGAGKGETDERWLFDDFVGLIERSQRDGPLPNVWLENVPGVLYAAHRKPVSRFFAGLARLGYDCRWGVVSAADAGAIHIRRRWWCMAWDKERAGGPPRYSDARRPDTLLTSTRWTLPTPMADDHQKEKDRYNQGFFTLPRSPLWLGARHLTGPVDIVHLVAENLGQATASEFARGLEQWASIVGWGPPEFSFGPRINPRFSEWMMGHPEGWTTDVVDRPREQLRLIGGSVVPQAAELAFAELEALTPVYRLRLF